MAFLTWRDLAGMLDHAELSSYGEHRRDMPREHLSEIEENNETEIPGDWSCDLVSLAIAVLPSL